MSDAGLTLHYAPRSRSATALWLMEELGEPYTLESFSLATGHHKTPAFLAINPMGKVPAVVDHGRAVAELGAIAIHLADRYPAAGLAPAIDHPQRPDYLRWIFFSSAIFEPALAQKFFGWTPPASTVAWGSYDEMIRVATAGVQPGPWLLGDHFTAADVLVASGLGFGMRFGAIPAEGPLHAYVTRATDRPAYARAQAIEAREGARFPPA
ncbi:MAG: glutathione S-transferase family protein [Myxococcales bacterium]|nr:glutathione S-transferase family protein [Myxococcales bacterium]MCB9550237.1 glutathione S-transferase family protein [Myxococcales bacterium]